MDADVFTGGCACGQLTFRAEGRATRVGHCMTCRKASGSAFNAFAVFPADRVTISGEAASWRAVPQAERCFCPRCGSQTFYREADEIEIRLGAFDEPDLFTPTYELWIKRRESWLCTSSLAAYPENRDTPA
jgi:hypothetical protein